MIWFFITGVFQLNAKGKRPLEDVILKSGLEAEVIYDTQDPAAGGIGRPRQLAIDPSNGEIYLGQLTFSGGNILIIDPQTTNTRTIDFFSSGLGFSGDGNQLYFGVSNLMLGAWFKQPDIFRKFAIIPAIESVQVTVSGDLYVATSDFGPDGLYPESVLKVDRSNARFEPVFSLRQASDALSQPLNAMAAMAIDGDGNIYVGGNQGDLVIRRTDGSFIEGNSRTLTLGAINNAGLGSSPDGLVYHFDGAAGEVFAYFADGRRVLLAYGDDLKSNQLSATAIVSDGHAVYLASDKGELVRIFRPSNQTLIPHLQANLGMTSVTGTLTSQLTNLAISDAKITTHTGQSVLSDINGRFQLDLEMGLYELKIEHPEFAVQIVNIAPQDPSPLDININLKSALPGWLAPGLSAEIVANKIEHHISGSTDINLDAQGNLWSINHTNSSITHSLLDPLSRGVTQSDIFAQGGNMANAWFIASDNQLNIFTSSSNAGVLKLPPVSDFNQPWQLSVDPNQPNIVTDQFGVNRMDSLITDVDGAAKLANGDMVLVSGAGGSIVDNFPDGTFDSLIRQTPDGSQTILSRGVSAQGVSLFDNPDITKADPQDRLLVSNRNGNLVRVNASDGIAELIWPGDGNNKPEALSAYTTLNDDGLGNLFIRGASSVLGGQRLSMISADRNRLLLLAADINSEYGGFEFAQDGKSLYFSDWDFIIRIEPLDDRTIAENLLNPVSAAQTPIQKRTPSVIAQKHRNPLVRIVDWIPTRKKEDFLASESFNNNVPQGWAFEPDDNASSNQNSGQGSETETGAGSGSLGWLLFWLICSPGYTKKTNQAHTHRFPALVNAQSEYYSVQYIHYANHDWRYWPKISF